MQAQRPGRSPIVAGDGPLARVRPVVAFIAVAAVFTGGVLLGGAAGAALLGLLAAGVAVLLAVAWQALDPAQRALRVLVLLVLVGVAVAQFWR